MHCYVIGYQICDMSLVHLRFALGPRSCTTGEARKRESEKARSHVYGVVVTDVFTAASRCCDAGAIKPDSDCNHVEQRLIPQGQPFDISHFGSSDISAFPCLNVPLHWRKLSLRMQARVSFSPSHLFPLLDSP